MKVKAEQIFNQSGVVRTEQLFAVLYGLMPSAYRVSYDEELEDDKIDIFKANKEFLLGIFPKARIYQSSGRHIDDDLSCVTEERNENEKKPPVYNRDSVYALSSYAASQTTIILDEYPAIVTFDKNTMEVIYDLDSDFKPEPFLDDFFKKLPKCADGNEEEFPAVQLVAYNADSGYYTMESEINATNIDIDKNYNDDFKKIYEDIVDFLESEQRKSGLIVLNGEPGTGKTYFIRHLITKCKNSYILIPPSIAPNLSSPEFVTFLIENKDSVFILEDCESVIKDRSIADFANAVSSVLNMSDGLMSDIFNGKFICTFNADISSVDEAILRKGRCFAKYTFGKLDREKAINLLKERGEEINEDDIKDMTLADIYNYDVKNVEGAKQNKKIGF